MPDSTADISPQAEPGAAPIGGGAGPVPPVAVRDLERLSRNILLFSDGTGNSSAKVQKTNVWRLYEALDLGYPVRGAGQCVQLAYYDNGVGTSAFKLFAVLGGVFGFGLSRNIRDIYKFLCRNYQDASENSDLQADRIYAFGFSRGAYTIRLLIAMVTAMGLPAYSSEDQLDRDTRDVWREYRRDFHTNNFASDAIVAFFRALLRAHLRVTRADCRAYYKDRLLKRIGARPIDAAPRGKRYGDCVHPERRHRWWGGEWWAYWRPVNLRQFWVPRGRPPLPDCGLNIAFVGVWDTVSAYGGPMVEITRAVDDWIWPLSMPDYRLSPKIATARHALAIDDKRDSFQPLLWDEVEWAEKAGAALKDRFKVESLDKEACEKFLKGFEDRLQQVWFAGMHSDVGGGYDDESLSYVSLWWMIEHAKDAAGGAANPATRMRLIPEFEARIETFRNVYGPIHNSRGGAGAFYRYQPRYIKAWLDWDEVPAAREAVDAQGRRGDAHVAPATQPYRDVTIDRGRYRSRGLLISPIRLHLSVEERLRLATDGYGPNNLPVHYSVDDGIRGTPEPKAVRLPPHRHLDALGDRIKLRRFWYFVTMALALVVALFPWVVAATVDARIDSQPIENAINIFLPEFAKRWTHAMAAAPFKSLGLLGLLALASGLGMGHEGRMTDIARDMWRYRFAPAGAKPPRLPKLAAPLRAWHRLAHVLRRCDPLQGVLAEIKWTILPFILGAALFSSLLVLAGAAVTQLALISFEKRACHSVAAAEPLAASFDGTVDIADPCFPLSLRLSPGIEYLITVDVGAPPNAPPGEWRDADQGATPQGWSDKRWRTFPTRATSKYYRRVVSAPLMAPVIDLRTGTDRFGAKTYMIVPRFSRSVDPATPNRWEGRFATPKWEESSTEGIGRPSFFLNDAVFPLVHDIRPVEEERDKKGPLCRERHSAWGDSLIDLCGFYSNNVGTARVRIWKEDDPVFDMSAPAMRPPGKSPAAARPGAIAQTQSRRQGRL